MVEQKAASEVKRDQVAARREAQKANSAMTSARSAVSAKEKAKAALVDAEKQMVEATTTLTKAKKGSNSARFEAKRLAENNGTDEEVKAAYAKASALYSTVMDAKMRSEMAKKRVEELKVDAGTAAQKAKEDLLGAKDFTRSAADKVREAMKAQV